MSTIILYIYMFIIFFFLYLLPMACEMKNNEVQTFLPGPEVVVPRYRFGDEDPKNHGICIFVTKPVYIYIQRERERERERERAYMFFSSKGNSSIYYL